MAILQRGFYAQTTLTVARELLGQYLVREIGGQLMRGKIVETEAYIGPNDTACHANKGRTPRTEVMFGPAGYTYIYLIYGMYNMLNFITASEGFPAAVLIRAIKPITGLEIMQQQRQKTNRKPPKVANLTNGPGKLCQALGVDKQLNKRDATLGQQLWVEENSPLTEAAIATGPRIGIDYADLPDRNAPWRFWIKANPFVSIKK